MVQLYSSEDDVNGNLLLLDIILDHVVVPDVFRLEADDSGQGMVELLVFVLVNVSESEVQTIVDVSVVQL